MKNLCTKKIVGWAMSATIDAQLIFRAFADNILGFAPALCYGAVEFELLHGTLDELLAQPDVRAALAA